MPAKLFALLIVQIILLETAQLKVLLQALWAILRDITVPQAKPFGPP